MNIYSYMICSRRFVTERFFPSASFCGKKVSLASQIKHQKLSVLRTVHGINACMYIAVVFVTNCFCLCGVKF